MKKLIDTILCGDSAMLLKQLPDSCIDLVITSPPYYKQRLYNDSGLGIGQESVPDHYLEALLDTLGECLRVIKPTGNIVYNVGDKYHNGSLLLLPYRFAALACRKFPLRLVNEITWVKRNPTPRQFTRRLVSSTEPFFHFAASPSYYYNRQDFLSGENNNVRNAPSPRLGQKYRALIDNSRKLSKLQKQLAHHELDKVISDVHGGKIHSFRMKIRGVHAEAFGGQEGGRKGQMEKKGFTIIKIKGEKMKRDVIETPVENVPGVGHSAIFPLVIIKEFIRLLCPPKGLVLDPYIGSGTTAIAALEEDRHYLGIDIDPSYCLISRNRLSGHGEHRHAA